MKHRIHRLLALALCAVMALGCFSSSFLQPERPNCSGS